MRTRTATRIAAMAAALLGFAAPSISTAQANQMPGAPLRNYTPWGAAKCATPQGPVFQ